MEVGIHSQIRYNAAQANRDTQVKQANQKTDPTQV